MNAQITLQTPPKPWLAAVLSFLLPGLGHWHAGRFLRGLLAWLGSVGILALGFGYGFRTPLWLALTVVAEATWIVVMAFDAWRCARTGPLNSSPLRHWAVLLPLGLLAAIFTSWGLPHMATRQARYRWSHTPAMNMAPTLLPEDTFMIDTRHYHRHRPRHRDVLTIESPEDPQVLWVQRCVALAGDLVEIRDQTFYLNNEPQSRCEWLPGGVDPKVQYGPLRVPEGTIFCLGDNCGHSHDSRFWGPLKVEAIRGKVLYTIWPWERSSTLTS